MQEELQTVVQVVHRVGREACALWPQAKTVLFGSQVILLIAMMFLALKSAVAVTCSRHVIFAGMLISKASACDLNHSCLRFFHFIQSTSCICQHIVSKASSSLPFGMSEQILTNQDKKSHSTQSVIYGKVCPVTNVKADNTGVPRGHFEVVYVSF